MPKLVASGSTKLKTLEVQNCIKWHILIKTGGSLMRCVIKNFMDTELLKQSWAKLTKRGYTLSRPAPEVVNIITPTGYSTQIRLKRLPSYARYVR